MQTLPSTSVILSTHNSPKVLELVMAGYERQDVLALGGAQDQGGVFEVVIADDGSRDETRHMIRALRQRMASVGVPLVHVWQPHKGYYGKMAIVNRAIFAARGEYLILADGDVIPREDYVRTHGEMARPNTFLAGGDFRVGPEATRRVTIEDVRTGRVFDYAFLRSIGQEPTRRRVKLLRAKWVTRALDAANVSPARWSGSNCSAWKADLLRVGGFDETFRAPGKDDTELGHRLWHAGVRSRHGRHNLICLHLHHGSGNYSDEGRRRNREILADTIATKRVMARIGIPQIDAGDHVVER
jgi:glycosyltransferase involved in cell wall biosynthesis